MLCDVVLIAQERSDAAQLQDALVSIHNRKFISTHQLFPGFLIIHAIRLALPAGIRCVEQIYGFLAQRLADFLQGRAFLAAQKQHGVAVAGDGFRGVLIDRLELALRLQNNRSRYFTASDGGNQLIKFRD